MQVKLQENTKGHKVLIYPSNQIRCQIKSMQVGTRGLLVRSSRTRIHWADRCTLVHIHHC